MLDISKIQIQKQITTYSKNIQFPWRVCLIFQRYKFKSKLQQIQSLKISIRWCAWYFKDTNSKANYNSFSCTKLSKGVCLIFQRYKFKSKLQPNCNRSQTHKRCAWYFKDTNSKANYNKTQSRKTLNNGVLDISKIQIQKQITTGYGTHRFWWWVCLIFQRYKFKSKLQPAGLSIYKNRGVLDISKIQIQKQITTRQSCGIRAAVVVWCRNRIRYNCSWHHFPACLVVVWCRQL